LLGSISILSYIEGLIFDRKFSLATRNFQENFRGIFLELDKWGTKLQRRYSCSSIYSLPSCIFPARWMYFVTPILKNGRRSDISNYRDDAILSAIAKLFGLLNYRYEDLRGHLIDCQHGFLKSKSTCIEFVRVFLIRVKVN
jgi:hypothetical protein